MDMFLILVLLQLMIYYKWHNEWHNIKFLDLLKMFFFTGMTVFGCNV